MVALEGGAREMTDEELMAEFTESVQYVGEVKDWRDEPLTEESEDEPEKEGEEDIKRFTCAYCGLRRYHLPGQHDQCDHSPTGECVSEAGGDRGALTKPVDSFKGKAWIRSLNNYEYDNAKQWTEFDHEWKNLNRTLRRGK